MSPTLIAAGVALAVTVSSLGYATIERQKRKTSEAQLVGARMMLAATAQLADDNAGRHVAAVERCNLNDEAAATARRLSSDSIDALRRAREEAENAVDDPNAAQRFIDSLRPFQAR